MRATPRLLLWSAIAAYAVGFASLSILRHRAYNTGRYDLGNMEQTVWNTAHGHFLRMTSGNGEQISRLAAHFDPILAAFAPLWWLWRSPELLLASQALLVALGALPVFQLARKHLGSEQAAVGFALAYLLYPATQWLTLNEFHPVALATPFLLFAFRYLDDDRLLPFAIFAALAMTTKEEVGLVVACFGGWYALRRRGRAGLVAAAAGLVVSVVAVEALIPHFNHGESSFLGRYDRVGGSPAGIVRTLFTHPLRLAQVAFQGRDVRYLLELGLPLACLFVLAPLVLVAALPELALNVLSQTTTQASIRFHYTAAAIAPLVAAAIVGAGRLARRWPALPVGAVVVVLAVAANWRLGAIPLWSDVPGGQAYQHDAATVTAHDRIADEAVRLVPAGAVVSASNSLGAHLSDRRRVLSLPELADATWVVADETRSSYEDRVAPIPAATALALLRRDRRWTRVFERDGIVVFHRSSP